MPSEKIGFVGTGIMGAHMARHLAEKGYRLHAWNRSPQKSEKLLACGARVEPEAAGVAHRLRRHE